MKIIFGLGNPEKKYDNTYHNLGFSAIDYLCEKYFIKMEKNQKLAMQGEFFYNKEKIMVVKPLTFMNLSGDCVSYYMNKYKIAPQDIYVIMDDTDLPKSAYRYREKGSPGTHNGLRNIVNRINSTEINRLRIGIGKCEQMDLADYVLSQINTESKKLIYPAMRDGVDYMLERIKEKQNA